MKLVQRNHHMNRNKQKEVAMNITKKIGRSYLTKVLNTLDLTNDEFRQLAINEYFHDLYLEGRKLYKLDITYKIPKQEIDYHDIQISKEIVSKFFIQFHTRFLLPTLYGRHYENKKLVQPVCIAFLEQNKKSTKGENQFHHHVLYAVHSTDIEFFDSFLGMNTFVNLTKTFKYEQAEDKDKKRIDFTKQIKTSCLKVIDTEFQTQPIYASKKWYKYLDDLLVFPDSLKRQYRKNSVNNANYHHTLKQSQKTLHERLSCHKQPTTINLHK